MGQKYRSIQIARAFAALIVVLHHSVNVSNDLSPNGLGMPGWLQSGYAGVDIFFVISGFIISLVAERSESRSLDFIFWRMLRIIPFYWIFTCLWFAIAVAAGHPDSNRNLLVSLLVLPVEAFPVLGVGWSLEQEFLFYGLVAILLAFRRLAWLPHVLAFLFAIGIAWHLTLSNVWDYRLFSLYHFQFLLGVLLYRYRFRLSAISPVLLLGAGTVAFLAAGYIMNQAYGGAHVPTYPAGIEGLIRVIAFGVAGLLLIGGLVALEQRTPAIMEWQGARLAAAVGDSSYVLYLAHPIAFAILGKVAAGLDLSAVPAVTISVVLTTLFALIFHRLIEKRFIEWTHRKHARVASSEKSAG